MALTWKLTGDSVTVTVTAAKTATAGYWAEWTDDYEAQDNETASATAVTGVFMTTAVAGAAVGVLLNGIVTTTAGDGTTTAGKTLVIDNAAATKVEDGTTSGSIIGVAMQTSGADADVDVWLTRG